MAKNNAPIYMNISKCLFFKILILVPILHSSCATPKALEYRGYNNLRIENVGFSSTTLKIELNYFNPNNFGLQLKSTDLDIFINNNYLGNTYQEYQVTIPKSNEFIIPLSIDIDMKNLFKNSLHAFANKEVTVKISGSIKVGKANTFISFPVNYEEKQQFSIY